MSPQPTSTSMAAPAPPAFGSVHYAPVSITEWRRSDAYHNSFLIPKDKVIEGILKNNVDNGLPDIAVSLAQGKFLHLLVRTLGAKRVLEVGTLGGFSTVWFARGLPADGKITTLELSPHFARVAQDNIDAAGLTDKVEIIVGPAADSLAKLEPAYDIVFVDADKPNNPTYYREAKRLVRKGGVIIIDNAVWAGLVASPEHSDAKIEGIRSLLALMKGDPDVDATTVGTVGDKGYDGFIYAIRN